MNSAKVHKQSEKRKEKKKRENLEEELNIRYHDVSPEWNYTISPRTDSKQTKSDKK